MLDISRQLYTEVIDDISGWFNIKVSDVSVMNHFVTHAYGILYVHVPACTVL